MSFRNAFFLLTLSACAITANAQGRAQTVLQTPQFGVTTEDFHYYVESNIPEAQREKTLAREGSVRDVYENLYVIKAFAARGEDNSAIDQDEIDWMTRHYRERLLMARQLDLEVAAELGSVDWEAAAREDYIANSEKYLMPEQVSASHILISTDEHSDEEAQAIAQQVLEKLREGAEFVEVAREYSEDGSVTTNGGDLGFFGRGQMVAPFEEAVFAMSEPGEISDLVKSQFGYHIIRFQEHRPAAQRTFEQVKASIIPTVKRTREQRLRADKITDIKSGAVELGLEVNVELLQEYEERYAPDEG